MKVDSIKNICAIGAGAMGSGTALCFAVAGYEVHLYDLTDAAVQASLDNIRIALGSYVQHKLIAETDIPRIMAQFKVTTSLQEAATEADFVIESIVEDLVVKQKMFAELDALCPSHTIFGTNTSGLSPTDIASAIERKDRFVVTHFWNPPHLMPLVEVVPGKHTAKETVDVAYQLMERIGKEPVRLERESLGFIGNRLQVALLREAYHIVASGMASAEDVDKVTRLTLGLRLGVTGIIESADLGGLDVFRNIFSYLGADLCNEIAIPSLLKEKVKQGKIGAKSGEGMYSWPEQKLAEVRGKRTAEIFRYLTENTAFDKKRFGEVA